TNAGTLTLGAGTTLTAPGLVNTGTLTGAGTVAAPVSGTGTVSPGLPVGRLSVTGDVGLGGLAADLAGTTAGTQYDQLAVAGAVAVAGPLHVALDFTPAVGDAFVLIDNDGADAVTGTFAGLPPGASVS